MNIYLDVLWTIRSRSRGRTIGSTQTGELIATAANANIAEHIVELHNDDLEARELDASTTRRVRVIGPFEVVDVSPPNPDRGGTLDRGIAGHLEDGTLVVIGEVWAACPDQNHRRVSIDTDEMAERIVEALNDNEEGGDEVMKMKSAIGRFVERLLKRRYGEPPAKVVIAEPRRWSARLRMQRIMDAFSRGEPPAKEAPKGMYRRACQRCTRGHATIKGWLCLDPVPCPSQPVTHSIAIAQGGRKGRN